MSIPRICVFLACAALAAARSGLATTFYVSPAGDDGADGLATNRPLRTIAEAVQRVRALGRPPQPQLPQPAGELLPPDYGAVITAHLTNLTDEVTIGLLPGLHTLDAPMVIDGSVGGNLRFEGLWAPGAEEELRARLEAHGEDPLWMDPPQDLMPVVSGGRAITNWTPATVNGVAAWAADLPEVASGAWYFHQLFVDGRRATRSRWPKRGWFRMAEIDGRDRFRAAPGHMRSWSNLTNVEVVALHYWVESRIPVASYDPGTRWATLQWPASMDLTGSAPVHGAGNAAYYVDHVLDTLSEPGEWCLDPPAGRLYYVPLPGQTPDNTTVTAPVLSQFFRVEGNASSNAYLWQVTFHRLAFLHSAIHSLDLHDHTGNNYVGSGPGVISFRAARAPAVEACLFGHLGEAGVEFERETMRGRLSACRFRDLAGGASKSWQSGNPTSLWQRTAFCALQDNDLKGYGRFFHGAVGMLHNYTAHTLIEHNHVRDGYYNPINCTSGSGTNALAFGFANTLRKNLIHDYGQGWLSDMGGLYVARTQPYAVMEGNVVFGVATRDYTGSALYLDDDSQYWTVRDNLFYGGNDNLVTMKGYSHTITNNVFAFAGASCLRYQKAGDVAPWPALGRWAPFTQGNILLQNGSFTYVRTVTNAWDCDRNLLWNLADTTWAQDRETVPQWRTATGKDLNSIVADPLLADPLRGDFRVPTNSPAVTQLGFVPFDNADAGPRSNVWAAAGAVWCTPPGAPPAPGFRPADIPGLQGWLDAADFAEPGPAAEWPSKTWYTYGLRQYETNLQPQVVPDAANGRPVVRFNGQAWLSNREHSTDTRQGSGRFDDRPFAVFTVHRSTGDAQVVLAKGAAGTGGEWTIGEKHNALRWNGVNDLGQAGTGLAVRAYLRRDGRYCYYGNGSMATQATAGVAQDFASAAELYVGCRSSNAVNRLAGDIGEILVYEGAMSGADLDRLNEHLMRKWLVFPGPAAPEALSVSAVTTPTAIVSWRDASGDEEGFRFYCSDTETRPVEAAVSGTATQALLSGLAPGTAYRVWVEAWNGNGASLPVAARFTTASVETPFDPRDVDGLNLWLDADDFAAPGAVATWADKSGNGYDMSQATSAWRPGVSPSNLNGRATVGFWPTNWLAHEASAAGTLGSGDFAILTVYRSSASQQAVLCKGTFGGSGRFSVGYTQHQLRWNGTNLLGGVSSTGFAVRVWERRAGTMRYWENGEPTTSTVVDAAHAISSGDPLYVGKRGTTNGPCYLDGDIAEILIYTQPMATQDVHRATRYLVDKWFQGDADGDGMADDWERAHFVSIGASAGLPDQDWDGDGSPDGDEYIAGTDPTVKGSCFRIVASGPADTRWQIRHPYAEGRLYEIIQATGLLSAVWEPVAADLTPEGDYCTRTFDGPTNRPVFFRARVRRF